MKRKIYYPLFVLLVAMVISACQEIPEESFERSDYYTRGIGQYPGLPEEDPSPELAPSDEYRNIARLRTAYHSSSYDYNLTAQLVTDGIITTSEPAYMEFTTHDGQVRLREREWTTDGGPYSKNTLSGADVYMQYAMHNWSEKVDEISFLGTVAYDDKLATKGYKIIFEGSKDGAKWSELALLSGEGLPGYEGRNIVQTDPNKQTQKIEYRTRTLSNKVKLSNVADYAYYRMRLVMEGAVEWSFTAVDFFYASEQVNMLASKHFGSAWMSAGAQEEWVYIDLGSYSKFDKIILHWIHRASKGKIQTSNDAKHWSNIASLSSGSENVEQIECKGAGRYVRILMQEPSNGERYALSEVEIMGCGGIVAQPKAQPKAEGNKYALMGGGWMLQRSSEVDATGEAISKTGFNTQNWVVATVPGTVLTSYKNVGAIPNPNYADNIFQVSESFFNSDFWYRNEFEVAKDFAKEKVFLNFDGLNWKADIYLNGEKIGRQEGAFIRGTYDVTNRLVEGKNVLAVKIEKNAHIGAVKEKYEYNTDFNGGILGADNPTFHATIGWDWISTIRGRNIGIYNDVYLTTSGKVTLHDPFVQTELSHPSLKATLTPEIIIQNHDATPVKGVLHGSIGDIKFSQELMLKAGEKREVKFSPEKYAQLREQKLKLWWPKGYGEPYLYDAEFEFKIADATSDKKE
ncbi:MAG: discoidin domain-containing protein, partial [Alistipes sp.]|nr:discoidin domain-containing protein [Alistipes sp.]